MCRKFEKCIGQHNISIWMELSAFLLHVPECSISGYDVLITAIIGRCRIVNPASRTSVRAFRSEINICIISAPRFIGMHVGRGPWVPIRLSTITWKRINPEQIQQFAYFGVVPLGALQAGSLSPPNQLFNFEPTKLSALSKALPPRTVPMNGIDGNFGNRLVKLQIENEIGETEAKSDVR